MNNGIRIRSAVALLAVLTAALAGPAAADDYGCDVEPDTSWCSGPSEPVGQDSCRIGLACDPRWDEGGEWWPDENGGAEAEAAGTATFLTSEPVAPAATSEPRKELAATGTATTTLTVVAAALLMAGLLILARLSGPSRMGDTWTLRRSCSTASRSRSLNSSHSKRPA